MSLVYHFFGTRCIYTSTIIMYVQNSLIVISFTVNLKKIAYVLNLGYLTKCNALSL